MKKQSIGFIAIAISVLSFVLWYQRPSRMALVTANGETLESRANEPISPLPQSVSLDERKVALGERLFNERQLSHDNSISCSSCHSLNRGGTDQLPTSIGIGSQRGEMNAPTVLNAAYNFKQFWDGRANTLEDQAGGPIQNPKEMGSSWPEVINKLSQSSQYVSDFRTIYSNGITNETIVDAIATYERSLITSNSRFDQYLRGDNQVLTDQEKHGYKLFKDYGCASCHQGINIGGNLFERFGVMSSKGRGESKSDLGRFNVTGNEADKYVFKVPSLRNVELTSPYFHDGSADTLEVAVKTMSLFQLGRSLTPQETDDIVAFLKTLTGEFKKRRQ